MPDAVDVETDHFSLVEMAETFSGCGHPLPVPQMPKMAPSRPSLDLLHAKSVMFVHKGIIQPNVYKASSRKSALCPPVSPVPAPRLTTIMLLRTNMTFLACSVSEDGPEGAIFGMWHWRVGGHTPRKSQSLSS